MRKPVTLITGANGEIGHGLLEYFANKGDTDVIALDLNALDKELRPLCHNWITGNILDDNLIDRLVSEYEIRAIFHLAALLSTRSEYTPETAHGVNVEGTLKLIKLAHDQAQWHGDNVTFLFPSSIAAYGLPDLETKAKFGPVKEHQWNNPITMYGINKLACEHLGRYYTFHYKQLASEGKRNGARIDFRAIRFPGLISAVTMPTGGTSDFAPEMLHAAAKGQPYACFVAPEARIPFMAMPDGVKALIHLAEAPAENLTQRVYNIGGFSPTALEIRDYTLKAFPGADITFDPDPPRAKIVDTWPGDVNDGPARKDWGWSPDYDFHRAFDEYLVPTIRRYYEEHPAAKTRS